MVKPHRGKELKKEITDLEEYGIYPFVTKQAVKLLSLWNVSTSRKIIQTSLFFG